MVRNVLRAERGGLHLAAPTRKGTGFFLVYRGIGKRPFKLSISVSSMITRIGISAGILCLGGMAYYWSAKPEGAATPIGASAVVPAPAVSAPKLGGTPDVIALPISSPSVTAAPEVAAKPQNEPKSKRPSAIRPKPELQELTPRRTPLQQAKWDELNEVLRSHLPQEVAAEAARLLVDHCLERAAVPRPKPDSTESDEEYVAKMRTWAIETRSVGKAIELDQLIPDAETKQEIYTPEFMGLLKDSCPSR